MLAFSALFLNSIIAVCMIGLFFFLYLAIKQGSKE